MPVIRGAAAEDMGVGNGITGLDRDTADGLGKTDRDERGADNLGKECTTADMTVVEHLACGAVPAGNLNGASAE